MIKKSNSLVNLIDDYFFEIVDNDLIALKETEAYRRIQQEKEELFAKYPNLEQVWNEKNISLNEEEVEGVITLLAIRNSLATLEMQCCYYKGMKDYIYLIDTIKNQK